MAAPPTEVRARRKQDDHLTIAHISDLHFNSQNTPAGDHFVSLQTEIVKSKVDMIIVTGDVADNPVKEIFNGLWDGSYTVKNLRKLLRPHQSLVGNWLENLTGTLEKARAFLEQLCNAADVKNPGLLCTVAGNHDLRIQGLVELPWFGTVNLAVENIKNQPFTKIFGTTSQDRLMSFSNRTSDSIISVAILCFNSNGIDPVLNFATGKVGEDDLNRMRQLESDVQFQKAHKIVLMHHHPMPIPESEGTPGVKGVFGGDQFLLLKNAGVVMRELVHSKIDLVLHGHKHYSGFSHVNFNFPLPHNAGHEAPIATHQVSIVGAGSAGIYSEGYAFNIIELYDDGRIYVQEKRRDHSGGYFPKRQFWLVNYAQKRIQRYDRCAESLQTELRARAKKLVYSVSIEDDGDAIERRDFTGLQALDQKVPSIPHVIRSVTGYLGRDEKPKVDFQSQDQYYTSIEWKPDQSIPVATAAAKPEDTTKIAGSIWFDPPLSKEHPVDISVITQLCNAFDFIKEYRQGVIRGQKATEDVTYFVHNELLDHLTIVLTFPEKQRRFNLAGKTRLKVVDSSENVDLAEWNQVSMSMDSIEDRQIVTLSVPQPLPGFKYRLEWELIPLAAYEAGKYDAITPDEDAVFSSFVRLLLQGAATKRGFSCLLRGLKKALAKAAVERFALRAGITGDDVELSLLVFDSDTMCLKVAGATFSEGDARSEQTFTWGAGIAGQAYKRGGSLFSGGANRYYVRLPGQTVDHAVLHAIPIYYPIRNDLPLSGRRILGILSLGSYEPSSYLFHFSSLSAEENSQQEDIGRTKEDQKGLVIAVNELFANRLVSYLGHFDRPELPEAGER